LAAIILSVLVAVAKVSWWSGFFRWVDGNLLAGLTEASGLISSDHSGGAGAGGYREVVLIPSNHGNSALIDDRCRAG
jgi:hypothetical protein